MPMPIEGSGCPSAHRGRIDSSGRDFAKGIISGGRGGDHSCGLFDPCRLYFTDIGLADSPFPGTVARY